MFKKLQEEEDGETQRETAAINSLDADEEYVNDPVLQLGT